MNYRQENRKYGWRGFVVGLLAVALFGLAGNIANAAIMSLFNFNDMGTRNDGTTLVTKENLNGTPTLVMVENAGTLLRKYGAGGTDFTDLDGDTHIAGESAYWADGIHAPDGHDSYFTLSLDTTDFIDMEIRFNYRSTNAINGTILGSSKLMLEYAVGGGTFNLIEDITLNRDNNWNEYTKDLSGISAIENALNVQIRGTWSNDGTADPPGAIGSSRIDNLQLTGFLIPEPSTLLLAVGGLALVLLGRRLRGRCNR